MKTSKVLMCILIAAVALQACALPSGGSQQPTAQPTVEAAPPVETTTVATEVPQEQNIVKPVSGTEQVASGHDNEESATPLQKSIQNGESYDKNRFERPFTANDMSYIPDVDIMDFSMSKDANFYYAQIVLSGVDPKTNAMSGYYGVELDLNLDGRSDFLVINKSALSTDWSRDGVVVYFDSNGDVGGKRPTHADANYTGNGFDTVLFDSGQGDQPDLAWARQITGPGRAIVEFAFKSSLLQNYKTFLFDVMASANPIEPSKFYYSDSMTEAAAGSPVKGPLYPLKGLAGFDDTCRIPVGFEATGSEPLGCLVIGPEKEPTPAPPIVIPGKG